VIDGSGGDREAMGIANGKGITMMKHMTRGLAVAVMGLFAMTGAAYAVQTIVTLDVIACDPNDPNDANAQTRLVRPTAGQVIGYAITAIVAPDDDNYVDDLRITSGLGAAYVTLNTNFGDSNCVREANWINSVLTPLGTAGLGGGGNPGPGSTGLVRGDDVTDIGGSQDLLGDSNLPVPFADGNEVIIATGTLTVPDANGVYHVWVTTAGGDARAPISVLEPNLTQPPFGRPPDQVVTGQGFNLLVGPYYVLTVHAGGPGHVDVSPNMVAYPAGTEVTLTAVANEGKTFDGWYISDPNHPGDANYREDTPNNPIAITMDSDREVGASFSCGNNMGATLPLAALGVLGVAWAVRRLRFHA
jgi:hypothetical protein